MRKNVSTSITTSLWSELLGRQIAPNRFYPDNGRVENGNIFISYAFALDINDAQADATVRPAPPQRIRRQGPPTERHLSLARNLRRDVWKVTDPEEKARRNEEVFGSRED